MLVPFSRFCSMRYFEMKKMMGVAMIRTTMRVMMMYFFVETVFI